jgi:hypothetical protein
MQLPPHPCLDPAPMLEHGGAPNDYREKGYKLPISHHHSPTIPPITQVTPADPSLHPTAHLSTAQRPPPELRDP